MSSEYRAKYRRDGIIVSPGKLEEGEPSWLPDAWEFAMRPGWGERHEDIDGTLYVALNLVPASEIDDDDPAIHVLVMWNEQGYLRYSLMSEREWSERKKNE